MLTVQILPEHILLTEGLRGTFPGWEGNLAATVIVTYCMSKQAWVPFTMGDLTEWMKLFSSAPDGIYILLGFGYLTEGKGGQLQVTEDFVRLCYQKHPHPRL